MNLNKRIEAFAELGEILRRATAGIDGKHTDKLNHLIDNQHTKNPWFTPENVRIAIKRIADDLTYDNLTTWTSIYPELKAHAKPFTTGVIMAGNIPLVGFHDFLSVLISGNNLLAKTSSKDLELIVFISEILYGIDPEFKNRIRFAAGTLSDFDAVIATGSDNSSLYFEYYFGRYPGIIRKNRNSVAIINGSETDAELEELGKDVFLYFGLGCRNVSKLFVPADYDLTKFRSIWSSYSHLIHHSKYASNYDFHKAVFLVNKEKFIDTGYLLLKESVSLSSPVAVLNYEHYSSAEQVKNSLEVNKEKIQCIAGKNHIPFGLTQSPVLWDYADGIDTLQFLLKKISPGIL
jgi:hypothetical protein